MDLQIPRTMYGAAAKNSLLFICVRGLCQIDVPVPKCSSAFVAFVTILSMQQSLGRFKSFEMAVWSCPLVSCVSPRNVRQCSEKKGVLHVAHVSGSVDIRDFSMNAPNPRNLSVCKK